MFSPDKSLLSALCLLLFCNLSIAQNGTIKGTVVDNQTRTPIEYASIALLHWKDSTVVAGALSKKNGSFHTYKT
jgi:ferric enterobactin receptor